MPEEPAVLQPKPTNWAPNRKPVAGIVAAGLVVVAVWASKAYGGVEVPTEIATTLTGVLSFAVSYFVPESQT